jgi:hypothetical protein
MADPEKQPEQQKAAATTKHVIGKYQSAPPGAFLTVFWASQVAPLPQPLGAAWRRSPICERKSAPGVVKTISKHSHTAQLAFPDRITPKFLISVRKRRGPGGSTLLPSARIADRGCIPVFALIGRGFRFYTYTQYSATRSALVCELACPHIDGEGLNIDSGFLLHVLAPGQLPPFASYWMFDENVPQKV